MSWLFGSRAKDVGLEEQKMREEEQERDSFYHSGFTYNTEREFRNNYSAYAEEERENGPTTSNDLDSNALLSKILELFFVVLSTLGVLFTFPFSLFFSVKFVSSFEQLIVFRLGKARKIYGPGTVFVLPCIDNVAKIDMRVNSFEIPPLQIITADKGLVEMTTVVFSRVVDPMAAHCGLQDRDQTLRSLAYNIIYNQVVKKMLYDLTNPTYLSTLLEDCQKEINNFCKNLGVESTKISVTQMNVVKQGENQAMTLFNNLLKSDVGSQVMQHFTPHLKAYLDSNPGASSAATAAQNPLNSFEGTAQKQAISVQMSTGKTIYLFDVDGTLTPSRQNVSAEMWQFLKSLKEKVSIAVVGGSDFAKIVEQLGGDKYQLLSTFDYIFSENGLISYHGLEQLPAESINKALGEDKLQDVIDFCLLYISSVRLPVKRGNFIELRKGMINVSPIGRSCSQAEREQFVAYESQKPVRQIFVEELRKRFESYNLTFSIGGQISIDIFPSGWDKTYCLKYLSPHFGTIHFFGDKTFKGGNDYEIYEHPSTIGHKVRNPEHTRLFIENELKP